MHSFFYLRRNELFYLGIVNIFATREKISKPPNVNDIHNHSSFFKYVLVSAVDDYVHFNLTDVSGCEVRLLKVHA